MYRIDSNFHSGHPLRRFFFNGSGVISPSCRDFSWCCLTLFWSNRQCPVGTWGTVGGRGGTRYGCDIWSGGTDYSTAHVDSPGGPIILPHTWTVRGDRFRGPRGDCPRRDSSISFPHFRFLFLHFRFSFLISSFLLLVVTLVPTFSSTRLEVLIYNCTDTDFSREL